jgi:hypothetical protein
MLKTGKHEMDNKFLTQTFRHSFLKLYCQLTYQFVFEECFIKSNTKKLNDSLFIGFKQIKIES